MIQGIEFENPLALYAIPIILLVLLIITFKSFVEPKGQRFLFIKRLLLFISRALIIILLIAAIAAPYTTKDVIEQGDPKITIITDRSDSMGPYDISFIESLRNEISKEVNVKIDDAGNKSQIADAILRNLDSRTILLVSDVNNYRGSDIDDAVLFASNSNVSISAINLKTERKEASISIDGPSETIEGIDNNFIIRLGKTGIDSVPLKVSIDGNMELERTITGDIVLTKQLPVGIHRIKAEIRLDDMYQDNNVFYKVVAVYEKPKALLIGRDSSLQTTLSKLYNIEKKENLPDKLNNYLVLIIDDVPASKFSKEDVDKIYDFLNDGNGLVVFGGKNSFEYGGYYQSYFEGLLPAKTGTAEKKQNDQVNVVLLIDTSGSLDFYGLIGNYSGTDIAKAYALDIIKKMKPSNKVAVIAFNVKPYVVSELIPASNTKDLQERISTIQNCGKMCGTLFYDTFKTSIEMLEKTQGSKNIIVASDGQAQDFYKSLPLIKAARAKGIVTYGINIAEPGSVWGNMQELASIGGGQYFRPTEAESITLIFGKGDEKESAEKALMIRQADHFITKNLEMNAYITGFNQIVPKTTAIELISTIYADPLLVTGRVGLGRTAVIATDSAKAWSGNLFASDNSKIVSRTINWAIGNPNKNKPSYVVIKDVFLGENVVVMIKSDKIPMAEGVDFEKIDELNYRAILPSQTIGVQNFMSRDYAVNYDKELLGIGMNPAIEKMTKSTRGKIFAQDDAKGIIETAKLNSTMVVKKNEYYSFYLMAAAMLLLLVDITVRRIGVYLKR